VNLKIPLHLRLRPDWKTINPIQTYLIPDSGLILV